MKPTSPLRLAVDNPAPDRPYLMRLPEVCRVTGLSGQTVREWVRRKIFPASFKLANGYTAAWNSQQVFEWVDAQIAAGKTAAAPA